MVNLGLIYIVFMLLFGYRLRNMGITGLIPFLEKASKRTNVSEFSGCTVAIDSYCWLHKGAFACAEKLVRGEQTDIHIKYCMKYVTMLLSKNIKPILVFDGRHLPAKALTEAKRRESRDISKKRAAELLGLGKIDEARSYMRRSIDITHSMALALIKECRKCNVDCIVAPYEADAQLAYMNIKNIAQLVITEDSDLILFGCNKVLFKMDLEGFGTLVETIKLPLVMKCPIEQYTFDKFRRMCIMSGCDYLASLPGIGLAKARQFVTATNDPNFANALRKLPSFFNRSSLTVTDEYRENFLKAEATFQHQYVYDPIERQMVRLTEVDDEELEEALCVNAGELLDPKVAFQLALGNLDPFSLKKMDDWQPDNRSTNDPKRTGSWSDKPSTHPSIWSKGFIQYLNISTPWLKKKAQPILIVKTRPRQVVNLVPKYVPETQDESLSIESLSNMYSIEPAIKKQKMNSQIVDSQTSHNIALNEEEIIKELSQNKEKSPILENKHKTFKQFLKNSNSYSVLKKLSRFPRTTMDDNIVESKFFNTNNDTKNTSKESITIDESPEKSSKNPFKVKSPECKDIKLENEIDVLDMSQKENSMQNSPKKSMSPIISGSKYPLKRLDFSMQDNLSEDIVIENTYPLETLVTPVDSQSSFGASQVSPTFTCSNHLQPSPKGQNKPMNSLNGNKKPTCRVPGLKRTMSLPSNQPTLLSKFGFQKKPALKR